EVHLAGGIAEQAQPEDLVRHPGETLLGVVRGESGEHEKPCPDLPGHFPGNPHFRARDALEHHSHRPRPTLMRSAECGMRNCRAKFDPRKPLADSMVARSIPHSALRIPHSSHSTVTLFARLRG